MKKHKFTFELSSITLNWIQLLELKYALAQAIKHCIELEKELGLKPKYFSSTRTLIEIYKEIINKLKEY